MIFGILGNVTSLDVAVGEPNFIPLVSGQSALIRLRYEETSPSSNTFSAVLDTGHILDNSSVSINSTNRTIDYVIHSSTLSSLSFGGYIVNLTLNGEDGSFALKEMLLEYEERISSLTV
jgi:hypothetical protein